jgi:hypothetical protein
MSIEINIGGEIHHLRNNFNNYLQCRDGHSY